MGCGLWESHTSRRLIILHNLLSLFSKVLTQSGLVSGKKERGKHAADPPPVTDSQCRGRSPRPLIYSVTQKFFITVAYFPYLHIYEAVRHPNLPLETGLMQDHPSYQESQNHLVLKWLKVVPLSDTFHTKTTSFNTFCSDYVYGFFIVEVGASTSINSSRCCEYSRRVFWEPFSFFKRQK